MKTVIIFLSFMFVWPWPGHASEQAMAAPVPSQTTHVLLEGVVRSVSKADANRGTESEIVVIDLPSHKIIHLLVTSTTTLWDPQAAAIMLEKVMPRRHVKVVYMTTPEGVNIAKSIKIIK